MQSHYFPLSPMSLDSPTPPGTPNEMPSPAELAAGFEEWRERQQKIAEQKRRLLKPAMLAFSETEVKKHPDHASGRATVSPQHYQDSRRSWDDEALFAAQQQSLAGLPHNAQRLPQVLLEINTGNGIHAYGDGAFTYKNWKGEEVAENKIIASLTREVASAAFAQVPAYDAREEYFGGGGSREVVLGRLAEMGINPGDAVIKVVRGNRTAFYHATTGMLIADPYASEASEAEQHGLAAAA